MSKAGWLFGAAAFACAVVVGFVHLTNPRIEVRTHEVLMPSKPTLEQFRRNLEKLRTIQTSYQMVGGVPMRCALADSTFDPRQQTGVEWVVQWCYQVPLDEAVTGGLAAG